jgi:hypothetical protein
MPLNTIIPPPPPCEETDECAQVTDSLIGLNELVCDTTTFEFMYRPAPFQQCGTTEIKNTASLVTQDTKQTITADCAVSVKVECEEGCTLTPGYWKTHSIYGPAPYDDTWAKIGEDTIFFKSGQSWYQVLWTAPKKGNAYYILAHQYIAAKLNMLNGASSTPDVDKAMAGAEKFFKAYKPSDTLSNAARTAAIVYADILDDYNNGEIGPGHCKD